MGPWATLLVAALGAASPPPQGAVRLVVVPFENASRRAAAREAVMPAVEGGLSAKGYALVAGQPVEEFLQARRIRYLDSLAEAHARELLDLHEARALVTGTILTYDATSRDPVATVAVQLVARDGTILWTAMASLSASASVGALGLGKLETVDAVARRAVGDALATLPRADRLERVRASPGGFPRAPRVFRSVDLLGQPLRICVLPLQNFTQRRDAPRIVDAVLQQRISERADMSAVTPGDLRAAVVRGKFRAPSVLSLEQLAKLSDVVGTSLFLRGQIFEFGTPDPTGAAGAMELYLSLVDARTGQTMWSGLHRRTGSDYETVLGFGTVRDDATLAGRVVAELLEAFTKPGKKKEGR